MDPFLDSHSELSSSNENSASSPTQKPAPASPKRRRGREATVYDAVAGRVTLNGALGESQSASGRAKRRLSSAAGRYSARNPTLAPEEVLFRRKDAPVRYAEQDIYWASEDLPDGGRRHLPDGGLLRSVHAYASRFYEAAAARLGPRCAVGGRLVDERSMDETALLAFGILLEEACRDALGKRGDLVFTEPSTEPRTPLATRVPQPVDGESAAVSSSDGRRMKRRKVAKGGAASREASAPS